MVSLGHSEIKGTQTCVIYIESVSQVQKWHVAVISVHFFPQTVYLFNWSYFLLHYSTNHDEAWHIEAKAKWTTFSRRHLQMIFNGNVWISVKIRLKHVRECSWLTVGISCRGSSYGLVLKGKQPFTELVMPPVFAKPLHEPDLLKVDCFYWTWNKLQWNSTRNNNKKYNKKMYLFCKFLAIFVEVSNLIMVGYQFKTTIHTCHMPLRGGHNWQSWSVIMQGVWLNGPQPCRLEHKPSTNPVISFVIICLLDG